MTKLMILKLCMDEMTIKPCIQRFVASNFIDLVLRRGVLSYVLFGSLTSHVSKNENQPTITDLVSLRLLLDLFNLKVDDLIYNHHRGEKRAWQNLVNLECKFEVCLISLIIITYLRVGFIVRDLRYLESYISTSEMEIWTMQCNKTIKLTHFQQSVQSSITSQKKRKSIGEKTINQETKCKPSQSFIKVDPNMRKSRERWFESKNKSTFMIGDESTILTEEKPLQGF